jgi:hypothetical protein
MVDASRVTLGIFRDCDGQENTSLESPPELFGQVGQLFRVSYWLSSIVQSQVAGQQLIHTRLIFPELGGALILSLLLSQFREPLEGRQVGRVGGEGSQLT